VSSPLSGIPIKSRRRLAATVCPFALLFLAVGIVASTGSAPGVIRLFSAIALSVAALLGAVAWGVLRSVQIDVAAARLDSAIQDAMAAGGATVTGSDAPCGCGHDHDADEMHVSVDACAHDGSGADCAHTCESCVLAWFRPAPAPLPER
jgi:hypothetical protein